MKKSSFKRTFEEFAWKMDWYANFLCDVYCAQKVISKLAVKREIFEAFALKIHCIWEGFVEQLLIDCLNKDTTRFAESVGIKGLPKHLPRNECKAIVLGTGYLKFRDVSQIKEKARKILVPKYNPFNSISNPNQTRMNEFYKIRNCIAHESLVAKRSLADIFKKTYKMKRFCMPGTFLMASDRRTKELRMEKYIDAFNTSAEEMAKFLGC